MDSMKNPVITYHPEELIELQRELLHPFHMEFNRTFSQRPRAFDEILTDLCTHFNIVVDGTYSPEDQLRLAKKITGLLQAQRLNGVAHIKSTRH